MLLKYPKEILCNTFNLLHDVSSTKIISTFKIPDTIHLTDEPLDWYFTNKKHELKKRNRKNIKNEQIKKTFRQKAKGCKIVARLIYLKKKEHWRIQRVKFHDYETKTTKNV